MLSLVATNLVPSDAMSAPAAIAPAIACPLLIAPARMKGLSPHDRPQLGEKRKWIVCSRAPTRALRDSNDPIDPRFQRLDGVPDGRCIVKNKTAIGVDGVDDLAGDAESRDDDGILRAWLIEIRPVLPDESSAPFAPMFGIHRTKSHARRRTWRLLSSIKLPSSSRLSASPARSSTPSTPMAVLFFTMQRPSGTPSRR